MLSRNFSKPFDMLCVMLLLYKSIKTPYENVQINEKLVIKKCKSSYFSL